MSGEYKKGMGLVEAASEASDAKSAATSGGGKRPMCEAFIAVRTDIFTYGLTVQELSLYLGIMSFASNAEGEAWPTLEQLAERIGVGRATVVRALTTLRKKGLLRVERQHIFNRNIYRLFGEETGYLPKLGTSHKRVTEDGGRRHAKSQSEARRIWECGGSSFDSDDFFRAALTSTYHKKKRS